MKLPLLDAIKRRTLGGGRLKGSAARAAKRFADQPFSAVSIETGWEPCDAAEALEGERFLSGQAPALPLAGCDAASCDCEYRYHADRRAGTRRDADLGLPRQRIGPQVERRDGGGRRAADKPAVFEDEPTDYFQYATMRRMR
jgi:hypothetical protein